MTSSRPRQDQDVFNASSLRRHCAPSPSYRITRTVSYNQDAKPILLLNIVIILKTSAVRTRETECFFLLVDEYKVSSKARIPSIISE